MEAKQYTTQYQEITEKIKEEIKNTQKQWQWKQDDPKAMGLSKSSSKGEDYSNKILPQETRKISNKKPNLTPKAICKRRAKNPQS